MSTMRVADQREGDIKLEWDVLDESPEGQQKVQEARQQFENVIGLNFKAYRLSRNTGRPIGEPITEFEADAEELLLLPPMAGGS